MMPLQVCRAALALLTGNRSAFEAEALEVARAEKVLPIDVERGLTAALDRSGLAKLFADLRGENRALREGAVRVSAELGQMLADAPFSSREHLPPVTSEEARARVGAVAPLPPRSLFGASATGLPIDSVLPEYAGRSRAPREP